MARKKNAVPSVRIRLDGYVDMPVTDPRVQRFLDWYAEQRKNRKAFPMAMALIIAALHGEMGTQVQQAVEAGDTQIAQEALDDLLGTYMS